MRVAAILAAAGSGKRLGAGKPKALVCVAGRSILRHAFDALDRSWKFKEIIVTCPPGNENQVRKALRVGDPRVKFVPGGQTRALSVQNALRQMSGTVDWVLIHDAARPLVSRQTVRRVILGAVQTGAALAALPVHSTVKLADSKGRVRRTLDRRALYLAQTPQVFRKDLLAGRYAALGRRASDATDDAALFEGSRTAVRIIEDSADNFKITRPEDLKLFRLMKRGR